MSSTTGNFPVSGMLLKRVVGLFGLVGVGLGLAGGVVISQLGSGGGIFGGLLILVVLTVAFLLAPVIGAITGLRVGDQRGQTGEAYLSALVGSIAGYYLMMVVLFLILFSVIIVTTGDGSTGSTAAQSGASTGTSSSGGGISIGSYIMPVVAASIPTAFTGLGGVYFGTAGSAEGGRSIEYEDSIRSYSGDIPWKPIGIGTLVILILIIGVTVVPSLAPFSQASELEVTGDSSKSTGAVFATGSVANPTDSEITTTLTVQTVINGDVVRKNQEQITISAGERQSIRIEAGLITEMSDSQVDAIRDNNYQIEYKVGGETVETYEA